MNQAQFHNKLEIDQNPNWKLSLEALKTLALQFQVNWELTLLLGAIKDNNAETKNNIDAGKGADEITSPVRTAQA